MTQTSPPKPETAPEFAPSGSEKPSRKAGLQVAAVALGALTAALTQTLILPVLPEITRSLDASASQAQWLLTSTLLVAAVTVPIVSRFADMFGRRLMLQIALGALLVGSVIDALTTNTGLMILGRALTGVSAAAVPLGISLLAANLPPERRGSATGLISAMLGVGGALGLPLAGLIGDNFDYHVLYWIGAAGGVLAIAMVTTFVREPRIARTGRVDWAGVVLLAGGLLCLVLPLAQGTTWGWTSPLTLGVLAAAVVLLALLTVVERHVASPLVNMTALTRPPVAITNIASVFVGFALFSSFVGTANYVQAPEISGYGFGSSVLVAGFTLLPSGVLMLVLSPLSARWISRWGGGPVLAVAGVILAAGLVFRMVFTAELWMIFVGSAIIGAGSGVGYAALPSLINKFTPTAELAAANGLNTLARSLGSTLASAIGGSLLAAITIDIGGAELPSLNGYRTLFAICAVAALLASAAGVLLSRMQRAETNAAAASPATAAAGH
jgi:MFS family permease